MEYNFKVGDQAELNPRFRKAIQGIINAAEYSGKEIASQIPDPCRIVRIYSGAFSGLALIESLSESLRAEITPVSLEHLQPYNPQGGNK